jgi:hypothetical protein
MDYRKGGRYRAEHLFIAYGRRLDAGVFIFRYGKAT